MKLPGKTAVVTGGASGIGLAIARAFGAAGAATTILDIDEPNGEKAVRELRDAGARADLIVADVGRPEDIERAIETIVTGQGGIDIVCNNAAVIAVKPSIEQLRVDEWDRLQAVNLRAVYLTAKYVVPHMRSRGGGAFVNIASIDAFLGEQGQAAYCASKGGILNLTRALALDFAVEQIRFNCVCPGMTDTPLFRKFIDEMPNGEEELRARTSRIPLGRLVEPEEVAAAAVFLASDDASAVTGTALVVDNGLAAGWEFHDRVTEGYATDVL